MKCTNCPYHYKTEEDLFPCCHCDLPEDWYECGCGCHFIYELYDR